MHFVCHYGYDLLRDFYRFGLMRSKTGRSRLPLVIFCSLVVIAGSIYFIITNKSIALFIAILVLILGIDALIVYVWFFSAKRAQMRSPEMFTAVNDYTFEGRSFSVKTNDEKVGITVKYDDLLRVIENRRYFYLYLSEGRAYILAKSEMTQPDIERLQIFLLNKCKGKYFFRKF